MLKGRERKVAPGEEPTFTWFKSGQEFDPEDRFKVLFKDEEDTLALVFQHINPEDAGLYTCVASTSTGKISCSAELSVEGGVTQLLKVRIWLQNDIRSLRDIFFMLLGTRAPQDFGCLRRY